MINFIGQHRGPYIRHDVHYEVMVAAHTWPAKFMRQMKKDAFVIGGGISLDPTEISYGTQ